MLSVLYTPLPHIIAGAHIPDITADTCIHVQYQTKVTTYKNICRYNSDFLNFSFVFFTEKNGTAIGTCRYIYTVLYLLILI